MPAKSRAQSRKATLLAVFGLGVALSCGPVQGENGSRLVVSATILATNACHITDTAVDPAAPELFRCSGPGSFKTHQMRVTRVPGTAANGAPGEYVRTVLLTLEP